MLMIAVAFPDDSEFIAEYMSILTEAGLDALFSTANLNLPGWLFWVSLMGSAYTYYVSAIASIKVGAKLYPTQDVQSLELIASSPKKSQTYFIENILASMITITLFFLPSFIILSIYSIAKNTADSIPRLAAMFLFNSMVCLFFVAITSFVGILKFSQSSGSKIGYFYLIYAFLIELGAGSIEEYKDYTDISVNSYLSPSAGILSGEFNWSEFIIVALLCLVLFLMSFVVISRPDYIERAGSVKKSRLQFLPKFSPRGKLALKYPLIFDQFRADRSYFFIWTIIMVIVSLYIVFLFNTALKDDPSVLVSTMASFESMLKAFTLGHPVEASFMGFLSFEVFGLSWLYYGVYILIVAINIPNRDQSKDEQDLIWSNSITPEKVIYHRTLSLIIFFTIYYWMTFFALTGFSLLMNLDYNTTEVFASFIVGYIYYIGLILLLTGIPMHFSIGKGKKIALWYYVISILLLLTAFMVDSVEFLKYLSIVYYYDPVGISLGKSKIIVELFKSICVFIISAAIYHLGLKYRFSKMDLL